MRRSIAALGVLLVLGLTAATAQATPACSSGCDVALGTYSGLNDQGRAIHFEVFVLHQKAGPHVVATVHAIRNLKTTFVTHCGTAANSNVDSATSIGYIHGNQGHLYRGEDKMHVTFTIGGAPTGEVKYQGPDCTASTHFTVHRVA